MFEKVLVCLDGSTAAEHILSSLTDEALRFGSKLALLRVVNPPERRIPVGVPGEPGIPLRTSGAVRRTIAEESEARDYLERIAGSLRDRGLEAECVVMAGLVGEVIVHYAQKDDFTLIAIASHGHGGLRRFAFGSTAEYVLRHSATPVLIVRPAV